MLVVLVIIGAVHGQEPQVARVPEPDLKTCYAQAAEVADHLQLKVSPTQSYGVGCYLMSAGGDNG